MGAVNSVIAMYVPLRRDGKVSKPKAYRVSVSDTICTVIDA